MTDFPAPESNGCTTMKTEIVKIVSGTSGLETMPPAGRPGGRVLNDLPALLRELGDEEHLVIKELSIAQHPHLERLARRLLAGQRQYGRLDLRNDRRDWQKEIDEERDDIAIYSAIQTVQAKLRAR